MRRYSPAFERNRAPILEALRDALPEGAEVLEVGCGPGQHAVFFADQLEGVRWRPSDRSGHLESARAWRQESGVEGVLEPVALDLFDARWELEPVDVLVAINVLHIAPEAATGRLFAHAAALARPGGRVFVYGPFRYAERELEPSNARFDARLRASDPSRGLRLFEDVDEAARAHGFELVEDRPMPANNHAIWWERG